MCSPPGIREISLIDQLSSHHPVWQARGTVLIGEDTWSTVLNCEGMKRILVYSASKGLEAEYPKSQQIHVTHMEGLKRTGNWSGQSLSQRIGGVAQERERENVQMKCGPCQSEAEPCVDRAACRVRGTVGGGKWRAERQLLPPSCGSAPSCPCLKEQEAGVKGLRTQPEARCFACPWQPGD